MSSEPPLYDTIVREEQEEERRREEEVDRFKGLVTNEDKVEWLYKVPVMQELLRSSTKMEGLGKSEGIEIDNC